MANTNVKFGLKPIGVIGGGPNVTSQYFIKSDASAIFQGSPVEVELTGGTAAIITSADGDGKQLLGVFAGCEYVDATTGKLTFKNQWGGSGTASTDHDIKCFVYDNPMTKFIIASDGTNSNRATAKADIFKTAQLATATAGNSTTGLSDAMIDISTAEASDPSNPLMIIGLHEDVTNADHAAAGISYVVKLNNHVYASSSGDADAAIS
tara:strand:- start:3152 stop:3775 length:624 start_codon:yes stop_codon:yes gene_type:complete